MKKVLFLGTHGQKNWGDELLLNVFIRTLEKDVDQFYVNSYLPEVTRKYLAGHNVKVFNTQTDRLRLLAYLLKCDAVVFGGGSIVKELYTAYGGERYATLRVLDKITKAASLLGKPVYFCNVGVGPIDTDEGHGLAKQILSRASHITVRDGESFQTVQSYGLTAPAVSSTDAVFSIDRQYLQLPAQAQTTRQITRIGINLCRNIKNNDNWDFFLDQLSADLTAYMKAHPQVELAGIPMQFDTADNNDEAALRQLFATIAKELPRAKMDIVKPASLEELAAAIDQTDMVLAERLHTLILSLVIGKPIVALEYDVKVTAIMESVGLASYGLDINQQFEPASILRLLNKISNNPDAATRDVVKAYQDANKVSAESFELVSGLLRK